MVSFIVFCKYLILAPEETVSFKQYMLTFPVVHQFFLKFAIYILHLYITFTCFFFSVSFFLTVV